ncbi:unnamed protein product, partial [Hapterophycus canaliculatus]
AGNLATASPISDMNPLLAACAAEIVLMSARSGERRVKVRDFFLGCVFAYRWLSLTVGAAAVLL